MALLALASALAFVVAFSLFVPVTWPSLPAAEDEGLVAFQSGASSLSALVDTRIGSGGYLVNFDAGNTFVGVSVPWGMVQLGPDTAPQGHWFTWPGGYSYHQDRIRGFSHTHLSGPGCPQLGDISFLPYAGRLPADQPSVGHATFRRSTEVAKPYEYRVQLTRPSALVELTASQRVGWHRYTFLGDEDRHILIDVTGSLVRNTHGSLRIIDSRRIEGEAESGRFCGRSNRYRVYFAAEFSEPFRSYGAWSEGRWRPGPTEVEGEDVRVDLDFGPGASRPIVVKVGISFVDREGAWRNLRHEAPGWDFDATRDRAREAWDAALGRIRLEGATSEQLRVFYTALYRTLLHPNLVTDVDGRYPGADGTIRTADGYVRHANFSLWDTYRTVHPLLSLVFPERQQDMVCSMAAMAIEQGYLPRWPVVAQDTRVMTGRPAILMLADAWVKGVGCAELAPEVYAIARQEEELGALEGFDSYRQRGFVPVGPGGVKGGATVTLEYALADHGMARLARMLGRLEEAEEYERRSRRFWVLYDGTTRRFRPRTVLGMWREPFREESWVGFVEGNAAHYLWAPVHDLEGLAARLGGPEMMRQELDRFFRKLNSPFGPHHWQGNEHGLHVPFLYAWTGDREAARRVVSAIAHQLYRASPRGLPGNDDLGTLSAWYVWATIGLYPLVPGEPDYVVIGPLVERVQLWNGRCWVELMPVEEDGRVAVTIDGVKWPQARVTHDELLRCGE